MKKYISFGLLLGVLIILSACRSETIYDIYAQLPGANPQLAENTQPDAAPAPDVIDGDTVIENTISIDKPLYATPETGNIPLSERIFRGEDELIRTGGTGMDWYIFVFCTTFYGIPVHIFMNTVGPDVFDDWRSQFESSGVDGWRSRREFSLRTFVDDVGITIEDFIRATEDNFGKPISEIDALVNWARSVDPRAFAPFSEEEDIASLWRHFMSLCDIEALFSDDIYEIWAAFPGYGVLYNGRAYSPEWILNNIERAIIEEGIPIHEIERVFEVANDFSFTGEILQEAYMTFQEVVAATR